MINRRTFATGALAAAAALANSTKVIAMAFKASEIAQISVQGMNYRDWESVTVHLVEGESNNSYRFTCSEGKPLAKNWADIRIRPGDHCTITLAGELAISGYVEKRQVAYTAEQHGIEIIGASYNKAAADGSVMHETHEFRKQSFQQIADKVLQPFGIKCIPKTPIPGKPFERACVPPGETAFHFLETLARMRGIILGTDTAGNTTARMFYEGGSDTLVEGVNILEGREEMSIAQGEGPDFSDGQYGGSNQAWGATTAHSPTAQSKGNGFGGQGVHAPNVNAGEHPGDKDDQQMRATNESRVRGDEQLRVTIVVYGWLKPSGGLWEAGKKVHVTSPMLIVDEELQIKSVTFTQDNKSGTRTTLELTRDNEGRADLSSTNVGPPPPAAAAAPPSTGTSPSSGPG